MNYTKDRELISQLEEIGVKIIDKNKRNVPGVCPNPKHLDNHPSFFFDLDTQLFQCFGCNLKGRGINKLRYQVTGVLVSTQESKILKWNKIELKKKCTPSIKDLPLALNNEGEQYLLSRGFTLETIKNWNIKFDKTRDSIMIPLEKMGFVERFLHAKKGELKYKYVPGSDIDSDLFGISKYNEEGFLKPSAAILVEGSLDAIWLHQLGYTTALALLHPDISQAQLKTLKGVTSIVYILLDNDAGGLNTEEKIYQKLRNNSFIVKKCRLPLGKDPNDCSSEEIEETIKKGEIKKEKK
jgi:DNA primase